MNRSTPVRGGFFYSINGRQDEVDSVWVRVFNAQGGTSFQQVARK